jgi:hypothetical protein
MNRLGFQLVEVTELCIIGIMGQRTKLNHLIFMVIQFVVQVFHMEEITWHMHWEMIGILDRRDKNGDRD